MKKKCFALFIPLLLCGCGLDANVCKDSNVAFPEKNYVDKYTVNETFDYDVNSSNDTLIYEYANLPDSIKKGQNEFEFASNTGIIKESGLNNIYYNKLFDGEISCSGARANSRLGLLSNGIVVDFENRTANEVKGIALYMSHNTQNLYMKATATLYKNTNKAKREFDIYNFSFVTVLQPTSLGAHLYYIDVTKVLDNSTGLDNIQMIGFKFERLQLTEEQKNSGLFMEYIGSWEEENKIIDENNNRKSFVKMYDMSLPYSTWKR